MTGLRGHLAAKGLGVLSGLRQQFRGNSEHEPRAWPTLGVNVERVMTDNGSAYRSKLFAAALRKAGVRHVRTRPYTPRTNGKAERFIKTSLREWAYARPYSSSDQRSAAIKPWINSYNLSRPHAGIGFLSPWQRLNNLLGNNT